MLDKDIKAHYAEVEKRLQSIDSKLTTLNNTEKRIEELFKEEEETTEE